MTPNAPKPAAQAPGQIPDPRVGRFHYAGVGGSGMSALAQFQVLTGGRASGSDRAFDKGERPEMRAYFEKLGVAIHPQDGSAVGGDCTAVVVSTAVESQVPDVVAARRSGIPIVHRSELLAHFVATRRTLAITGTSGKSTVVAMTYELLRGAGRSPSVITGGEVLALQQEGLWGNAAAGASDLLVVEADESDGTLVAYAPAVGVVLNLQKDHKAEHEVAAMFRVFRDRTGEALVLSEDENLRELAEGARARGLAVHVFGRGPGATTRGDAVDAGADASAFAVDGVRFTLPAPGEHNVSNALAAIACCRAVGVPLEALVQPLSRFAGVARRFNSLGAARGVEVIDDFAHNPAKIRAALATARQRAPGRVLAVYQAHGYGPTRFLRPDLVAAFAEALRPQDRLWMPEIYYAGGTAVRDLSAADLVADVRAHGAQAEFVADRAGLVPRIAQEARAGDLVLVMGARDPSLTDLARSLLAALARG